MSMKPVLINNFSGGQNSAAASLSMPDNASRRMLGVNTIQHPTVMSKTRGTYTALAAGQTIYRFARYKSSTMAGYAYTYVSGSNNILAMSGVGTIYTGVLGVNLGLDASFVQITNGATERLYIASNAGVLLVWWEALATAQPANWVAPLVAPTITPTGTGVLDPANSGATLYYEYVYTYVLASGTETSASAASARAVPSLQQDSVVVTWDTTSGIPTISSANIYRRGGLATDYSYVGNVVNSGGATATFTDNVSDLDLSADRIAPQNNGVMPTSIKRIKAHNNRLWGYSTSSNVLYFSGLSQYGVWGASSDGFDLEGGFLTLEGANDDSIIAVESLGDILIIGRKNSLYALIGNNFNQFVLGKRSSIGLISEYSMCRGGNDVYYLGVDYRVYRVGSGEPVHISAPIQDALNVYQFFYTFSSKRKIHPELAYSEGLVYVNIPTDVTTGASATYCFRIETQTWTEVTGLGAPTSLSFLTYGVGLKTARGTRYDTSGLPVSADEVAVLSSDRQNIILPLHYDGTSSAVLWKSRDLYPDGEVYDGRDLFRLDSVYIDGDLIVDMTDSDRIKLKVYLDGSVAKTIELATGSGTSTSVTPTIYDGRMAAGLVGRVINVSLEGNAKSLTVRNVVCRVEKIRGWRQ